MDETTLFLKLKALTLSLDMMICNNPDELTEEVMILSEMLVHVMKQYDDLRTAFLSQSTKPHFEAKTAP